MSPPETVTLLSWTGIERLLIIIGAIVAFFGIIAWFCDRAEAFSIYRRKKKAAEKARMRPINVDDAP